MSVTFVAAELKIVLKANYTCVVGELQVVLKLITLV